MALVSPMGKQGRMRREHAQHTREQLDSCKLPLTELPYSSTCKAYFRATCGVQGHLIFKAVATVNGDDKSLLCRVCCHTCKQPSMHEKWMYEVVQYMLAGEAWVVEAAVIPGSRVLADIFLPFCSLIIMVDGEHHFESHRQSAIDAAYNVAVMRAQGRMVRVHHHDKRHTAIKLVKEAITRCSMDAKAVFVWYTPSYGHPPMWG